jgi:regulator of ribosome biosynthesis
LLCFHFLNRLADDTDAGLKAVARDNTQLLFNRIFSQPALRTADGVFAELPARTTLIPREKPLPKEKPKTKWDEFARIKGIEKRKRSSKEWNEEKGEFMPRYGKKSANNDSMADWLVELPDNAPADFDAFSEKRKSKKQALKKQVAQEQGNRARARAKGSRAIAGASSVALLSGGKKLDRSALKVKQNKTKGNKETMTFLF